MRNKEVQMRELDKFRENGTQLNKHWVRKENKNDSLGEVRVGGAVPVRWQSAQAKSELSRLSHSLLILSCQLGEHACYSSPQKAETEG